MPVSTNVECRANRDTDPRNRSLPHHRRYAPYLQPVRDGRPWSADRLNTFLDRMHLPQEVNEPLIEGLLEKVEQCTPDSRIEYRLLLARVLEAALLCAGHYVDNCEFTAAGDLLANPRRILVHIRGCRLPIVKHRHGKLSEQLAAYCGTQPFPAWFRQHAVLEIAEPALVPLLLQRLERFQCLQPTYLDSIRRRMDKAADAIGFLSAWGIKDWEDMQRRIRRASPRERGFISANLCRFDLGDFQALGREIDRKNQGTGAKSKYIAKE